MERETSLPSGRTARTTSAPGIYSTTVRSEGNTPLTRPSAKRVRQSPEAVRCVATTRGRGALRGSPVDEYDTGHTLRGSKGEV
eukprot:CAMPEP_0185044208 /NCGR_PEP_ID=MMETSP1103-20130426/43320_1 /TAXON_ID=36769 /ORGANISM="Paraphysomonas bandaiensis, Strain Caron Lab Isolate" /LENGTH=82 /DNA_ID=CAMNT_0027584447 /DNA_START=221 /DNA_END=469 /DNA_ORIENTATION=-